MKNKLLCGVFVVVTIGAATAADRPHFTSQNRDGVITVDAKFDDWYGNLQPFGDQAVSIQALNDGEFLYLRLTASEPSARAQIMRQGLTVWFDPQGGTKKKLGIKYPVVEHGAGPDEGSAGYGGYGGGRGRGRRDRPDGAAESSDSPSDRVDVLGPGKDDARSLTRDHLPGIDVAIKSQQGILQYELKVPLARTADRPYAIETQPGKTIGLGIETPKPQQRSFGQGGGGFGGGGGGIGGRGMGGGRGGGGRGGRGGGSRDDDRAFQPPKPLKGWATVSIAPVR
jgi:hypothetical protein